MTVQEAINRADSLAPNQYTDEQKIAWLQELEDKIGREIFETHADCPPLADALEMESTLAVPEPDSVIYIDWLQAMTDFYNGEAARQQNSAAKFNEDYQSFAAAWNRQHMPVTTGRFRY
jgi:hypothetical protein